MPDDILRSTRTNYTHLHVNKPVNRDQRDSSPMPEEILCSTSINYTFLDVTSNLVSKDSKDSSPMPEEVLCSTLIQNHKRKRKSPQLISPDNVASRTFSSGTDCLITPTKVRLGIRNYLAEETFWTKSPFRHHASRGFLNIGVLLFPLCHTIVP